MKIEDWIDVAALKGQSKHLTAVVGVLASLYIVSHVASHLLGPAAIAAWIDYIDDFFTLVALFLYGIKMVYSIVRRDKGS